MADVCDNIARQALNKCVHLERILVRSKDQFLSDTECQSFGWGDWCVGTPSLLRYCSNYDCPILSKSHQSLIGLLGMVRNSGEVFPVASGVLYVAFALIFLAWVCLVGKVAFGVSQRLGHYVKAGFRDAGGPSRWLKGCKDYLDPLHDLSEDGRKHVREMVRSRTLRRFSSAAMAVSLVLPMVMLAGTEDGDPRNAAICKPHVQGSSCFQEQVYRHQRLASQTVGTTLLVGCCLVASLLPHIVCGKYVVFTHSALYIGIAWHLLDMVALPEFVELQQGFLVYVRIAAAVVHGDVFVVAVLNFSLALLQQFFRQYGYPSSMYGTEGKYGFDRTSRECFLHAIIIVFVTAVIEYNRIDLVKQALHAQESVAESTTVHGMLNCTTPPSPVHVRSWPPCSSAVNQIVCRPGSCRISCILKIEIVFPAHCQTPHSSVCHCTYGSWMLLAARCQFNCSLPSSWDSNSSTSLAFAKTPPLVNNALPTWLNSMR
eukprot:TRINITY_DN25432_c0_g1_i5.p1 TRINITY_DN25432_c0_g1~~TRINITY_DN25432_c0_g1_i5.p1  ORF type:complete len:486 (+),score=49.12 TRINITY_DN25432_c0_g1_i5:167-1624(+)